MTCLKNLLQRIQFGIIQLGIEEPKPRIGIYPYLSGDLFMAAADVALVKSSLIPIRIRNRNRTAFVETDLLQDPGVVRYLCNFDGVIIHNGDRVIDQGVIEDFFTSGVKIFATNVNSVEGRLFAIPVGIENAHLRKNGSMHFFNAINVFSSLKKKTDEVLVSFNVATNRRERMRVEALSNEFGFVNRAHSISSYRDKIAKSYFVISPPGNGIDCHRTWEAFYFGAVPVVEKQHWLFGDHELPVFVVDSYVNFFRLSTKEKHEMYYEIINKGCYDAIFFDYWLEFINERLINR